MYYRAKFIKNDALQDFWSCGRTNGPANSRRGRFSSVLQFGAVRLFPGEHLQPVIQCGQDGFQIFLRGLGAAGEVYNQGPAPDARRRPGQHGPGRDGHGRTPHGLGNPRR
ncbi:hypothetical protein SDC9_135696 [bioreactor metagenome]|uniref:Uncharacterized protein n=1 Tax=bioreactor metagenome TaxID=1076179 RepID=A0A645DJ29_9ZZZZ